MPRREHKAEEIVAKLRQVEVLSGKGLSMAVATRSMWLSPSPTRGAISSSTPPTFDDSRRELRPQHISPYRQPERVPESELDIWKIK